MCIGGLVHFDWRPRRTAQDMAITVAGPLSNLLLAGLAWILLRLLSQSGPDLLVLGGNLVAPPFHAPGVAERLLRFALYLNAGLALVNMLPAFPLDGGRLMYLAVARRWDNRTSTLVVGLRIVFAVVSALVTVGTLLAGCPVIAPPSFRPNWDAVQAARRGQSVPV